MFNAQDIHHMLEMYHLEYSYVGITVDKDQKRRFSEESRWMPQYTSSIHDKIHILDNQKLNAIGDKYYDLSVSWYAKSPENVERVKKNMANYFKNIVKDATSSDRMWGAYKDYITQLRGSGYTKRYVVFNERATNKYKDRTVLAYPVNLFMNTGLKNFYAKCGVATSNDEYALSVMVQWIWRSAIRDGKEIYIYLPSSRMRQLLIDWMNDVKRQYIAWAGSTGKDGRDDEQV